MPAATLDGFVIALAVVGGLELVDRTSFALIGIAGRSDPLGAWAGGASAFVLTTTAAVVIGVGLIAELGAGGIRDLRLGGGVFLLGFATYVLLRQPEAGPATVASVRGAFLAAFATILLLELGDTTMIFEVVLVPTLGPLNVFVGGSVGLSTVAAWDVWLGRRIAVYLAPETVRRVVAAVLYVVGGVTIAYALLPGLFAGL